MKVVLRKKIKLSREENDRSSIAKDLKEDSDESSMGKEKEVKKGEEKDKSHYQRLESETKVMKVALQKKRKL